MHVALYYPLVCSPWRPSLSPQRGSKLLSFSLFVYQICCPLQLLDEQPAATALLGEPNDPALAAGLAGPEEVGNLLLQQRERHWQPVGVETDRRHPRLAPRVERIAASFFLPPAAAFTALAALAALAASAAGPRALRKSLLRRRWCGREGLLWLLRPSARL